MLSTMIGAVTLARFVTDPEVSASIIKSGTQARHRVDLIAELRH